MFPRTIKNVNTWYFHTKTSTPIDCLSTYFYRSLVRKTVCFGLYIDKTCVPDVFSESPLNTDTRIIQTLWHVPLVSVLTGFHCRSYFVRSKTFYCQQKSSQYPIFPSQARDQSFTRVAKWDEIRADIGRSRLCQSGDLFLVKGLMMPFGKVRSRQPKKL